MELTGGQVICESLLREDVDVIFGLPGGAVLPLYDALTHYPELRHILVRHEQGAAHAADGYARATGKVGVCMVTSGPGVTNLLTGLAAAYTDSVPVVAITANVATHMLGRDAFQEVDTVNIARPITKASFLVRSIEELAPTLAEAFYLARTGRPRPVVVDVPKDILSARTTFSYPSRRAEAAHVRSDWSRLEEVVELIQNAERPVAVVGHGVILGKAYGELSEFLEKTEMPFVNTLLGLSSLPQSHRLSLGMIGMHGLARANMAVQDADLIVGLGARFDDRVCSNFDEFAPKARIVQVDIDGREFGRNVRKDLPVLGDVKEVLDVLNRRAVTKSHSGWLSELQRLDEEYPLVVKDCDELMPSHVVRALADFTGRDAMVVTDVGQHQMWTAQHFGFNKPNSFFTSGGLGTMGFGVPAAMGVKVGRPEETVWAVVGDGGFQMTAQELSTLVSDGINVKIAVINNKCLGMVRQWQELFYERRYNAVMPGQPDFVRLAEAYGLRAWRVCERDDVEDTLRAATEHDGPALIDFWVRPEENCYPMVTVGAPLHHVVDEVYQVPALR